MLPVTQPTLHCGEFAIDFQGRRLLRGRSTLPLEPKAFAVLSLLAGSPGRVFSRDEILDAVWGHRYVTPGVLNRVMTLLRHALGEAADNPRYLHTVYGVGYRFDLPEPTQPDSAIARGPPDGAGSRSPWLAMPRSARTRRGDQPVSRRLRTLMGRAGDWISSQVNGHPRASPTTALEPPATTLAVLPLRSIGDEPHIALLADGLTEELTTSLARLPALQVISRTSTMLAAAPNADLAVIGKCLGVRYALEGSVRGSEGRLRISLRLVDVATRHARWAQDFQRDISDVLTLECEIAQAVCTALQPPRDRTTTT